MKKTVKLTVVLVLCLFSMLNLVYAQADTDSAVNNKPAALFPVIQDKKVGYIGIDGKMLIKPQYQMTGNEENTLYSYRFIDGYAIVRQQDKDGVIDAKGNWVVKPQSYKIISYSGDRNLIFDEKSQKYGFIDSKGNIVIKPEFIKARAFKNGGAVVSKKESEYGMIGKDGKYIVTPDYIHLSDLEENLVIATNKSKKTGILDKAGKIAVAFKYDFFPYETYQGVESFKNGLALVTNGSMFGVINTKGETVIDFNITTCPSRWGYGTSDFGAYSFSGDLCAYYYKNQWTIFDRKGKIIAALKDYDYVGEYKDGFFSARHKDSGICFLNAKGVVAFKPAGTYNYPPKPSVFSEGFAPVYDNNRKLGFINAKGEWSAKAQYNAMSEGFSNGLALLVFYGKKTDTAYMDKTGKFVYISDKALLGGEINKSGTTATSVGIDLLEKPQNEDLYYIAASYGKFDVLDNYSANGVKYKKALCIEFDGSGSMPSGEIYVVINNSKQQYKKITFDAWIEKTGAEGLGDFKLYKTDSAGTINTETDIGAALLKNKKESFSYDISGLKRVRIYTALNKGSRVGISNIKISQ